MLLRSTEVHPAADSPCPHLWTSGRCVLTVWELALAAAHLLASPPSPSHAGFPVPQQGTRRSPHAACARRFRLMCSQLAVRGVWRRLGTRGPPVRTAPSPLFIWRWQAASHAPLPTRRPRVTTPPFALVAPLLARPRRHFARASAASTSRLASVTASPARSLRRLPAPTLRSLCAAVGAVIAVDIQQRHSAEPGGELPAFCGSRHLTCARLLRLAPAAMSTLQRGQGLPRRAAQCHISNHRHPSDFRPDGSRAGLRSSAARAFREPLPQALRAA